MQQGLQQYVGALTGGHSAACRGAAHSSNKGARRDATKGLARVVRGGSTSERQRLRDHLRVWLQLQDEEATESMPRQVQSWLTGKKTQQRKAFGKNRRHHLSQIDLIEIFLFHAPPLMLSDKDFARRPRPIWTGRLGCDDHDRTGHIGRHPEATETMDDDHQLPVHPFRFSEATQDPKNRARTHVVVWSCSEWLCGLQ